MKRLYVWVVIVLVVIGAIAAVTWAYLMTRPCTPPGLPALSGGHACPGPPTPSPTTFIANGTVFTVGAGQISYFQFQLSPASIALLTGSFTATHGAAVDVMTPGDFANFSSLGAAKYGCPPSEYCYSTGLVIAGSVNVTLPVFQSDRAGRMVVDPWFLVMQNSNSSADTNLTWVTSLVATYVDVYAAPATTTAGYLGTFLPYQEQ